MQERNGDGAVSPRSGFAGWIAALLLLAAASPVYAQIGLLQTPNLGLPSVPGRLPGIGDIDVLALRSVDRALQAPSRLTGLVRRSGGALDVDPDGWPVVAAEIVVVDLSAAARIEAVRAGFTVLREERLEALGLEVVVLAPPRRLPLSRAMARLRALDPGAEVSFNHVYVPAGETSARPGPLPETPAPPGTQTSSAQLGLIDTGVEATHPALVGARITQRGFAGPPRVGAHGTAVASLMVGQSGVFAGADPGAGLLVADIYGGQPAGGSSTGLAQALAWMVEQDARVVNISLVGPRNGLVERAVARAQALGLILVAASGNDGPAAPPLYPAAYEGVIGVSAVNGRGRILPETGRGPHVDFVAPGADMAAAGQAGTWTRVRGSSFAAPLVSGLIARRGGGAQAVQALVRTAADMGAPGRDPIYGAGLVGAGLRVEPGAVGARGQLSR